MSSAIEWSKRVDNDHQKNWKSYESCTAYCDEKLSDWSRDANWGTKQSPSLPTGYHSSITSSKSHSFRPTIFSASLTNLTVLLPKSRDRSYYVSRRTLAPPSLCLHKHTDPRAHDFAHSPDFWHRARIVNITCAWSWRLCEISPAVLYKSKQFVIVRRLKVCLSEIEIVPNASLRLMLRFNFNYSLTSVTQT
jgi:hypothetical protein